MVLWRQQQWGIVHRVKESRCCTSLRLKFGGEAVWRVGYVDIIKEFLVLGGLDGYSFSRVWVLPLRLSEGESIALDERSLRFFCWLFVACLQFSFGWFLSVWLPVAFGIASPFFILFFGNQDRAGHLSIDAVSKVNFHQCSNLNISPFPLILTVLCLYMSMLDLNIPPLMLFPPHAHLLNHASDL